MMPHAPGDVPPDARSLSAASHRCPAAAVAPGAALVCEFDDFDVPAFCALASDYRPGRCDYVVTANVDHLLRLHDDPSFRALYADAGYVLLDSRVVGYLLRLIGGQRIRVCPGSDLTAALLPRCVASAERVVLVGGTAAQAQTLATRYELTNLRHYEPPMGLAADAEAIERCADFIENESPFRFCFIAVGSPQQEMIAQRLRARGRCTGLALCVGAALNFLSGVERRAPRWMQRLALEWLFRLCLDPRRLAVRYLVRGPRIFGLLIGRRIVLRRRGAAKTNSENACKTDH